MKDYTINKQHKNGFILGYSIEGDKIIIKYASGKKYENFYTKELEKDILKRMKEQVLCGADFLKSQERNKSLNWLLCIFISFFLFSISAVYNEFAIYGLIGIMSTCIGCSIGVTSINKKIKDYKKNLLFVENMDLFQNGITRDMGMYLNMDMKVDKAVERLIGKKEQQEDVKEEDSVLREPTLNTIDKIAPATIDEIYDLLMRNEEFSKYYESNNAKKRTLKK